MSDVEDDQPSGTLIGSLLTAFASASSQPPTSVATPIRARPLSQLFSDPNDDPGLNPTSSISGSPATRNRQVRLKANRKAAETRKKRKAEERENLRRRLKEIKAAKSRRRAALEFCERQERVDFINSAMTIFNNPSPLNTLGSFLTYFFGDKKAIRQAREPAPPCVPPVATSADIRWTQFFGGTYISKLLNLWSTHGPPTIQASLDSWAIDRVNALVRREAEVITESRKLWTRKTEVNNDFVLGFSLSGINSEPETNLAPTSMRILRHMATSAGQIARQDKQSAAARKIMDKRKETVSPEQCRQNRL